MAEYLALERIVLPSGIVEPNVKFSSDIVPGQAWKPIDKEAKAAVKARDAAKAAAAEAPSLAQADARVAELEARVAELETENAAQAEQIEALTAPPADAAEQ